MKMEDLGPSWTELEKLAKSRTVENIPTVDLFSACSRRVSVRKSLTGDELA